MNIDPSARVQAFTFEECLAEFDDKDFPTLRASLANARPASTTKQEWLYDDEDGERRCEFNYTQVFRKVVGLDDDPKEALFALLGDIEEALVNGERRLDTRGPEPVGYMGGCVFFGSDRPRLRPLQQPVLLGGNRMEWLAEVGADFIFITKGTPFCECCGRPK